MQVFIQITHNQLVSVAHLQLERDWLFELVVFGGNETCMLMSLDGM